MTPFSSRVVFSHSYDSLKETISKRDEKILLNSQLHSFQLQIANLHPARNSSESLTLFIADKAITKLNLGPIDKLEIRI